ncbi:hypothetical protein ACQ7HM_11370 [Williamsia sp. MIQD14]|uniref:hypothetical protein n=1 Tax=Williamsia sp. MIQD14 TaxID=3425703 RepID=UPI003DA16589
MDSVNDGGQGATDGGGTSSRTKRTPTIAVWVVTLAALGGVVAAVLVWPEPDPQVTSSPSTNGNASTSTVSDPKAAIPGCDEVVATSAPGEETSRMAIGEDVYDNPRFPWFTSAKATAMSDALKGLLPAGAELQFGRVTESFVFQPITDFGDPDPTGSTNAYGSVINGDARGRVQVYVQKTSAPVPPCVTGQLDERRTLPDGTVVDVRETRRQDDGEQTIARSVDAYVADGSWIGATADDRIGEDEKERSGKPPLTIDDLVRIVSNPRLRVSTTVPPGTPAPREECLGFYGGSIGPVLTRDQASRLDSVLETIDFGGRKPLPLQPSNSTNHALCTSVPSIGADAKLDISIAGGQSAPIAGRPDPTDGYRGTTRRLADGSIVQTTFDSVVVTRPDGTQVSVTAEISSPAQVPADGMLESIALTPGLTP